MSDADVIEKLPIRLKRGLGSPDDDMRLYTIDRAEREMSHPQHGETIRRAVDYLARHDPSQAVRERAAKALEAHGGSPT